MRLKRSVHKKVVERKNSDERKNEKKGVLFSPHSSMMSKVPSKQPPSESTRKRTSVRPAPPVPLAAIEKDFAMLVDFGNASFANEDEGLKEMIDPGNSPPISLNGGMDGEFAQNQHT